jgi:hypothetical protein
MIRCLNQETSKLISFLKPVTVLAATGRDWVARRTRRLAAEEGGILTNGERQLSISLNQHTPKSDKRSEVAFGGPQQRS